MPINVNRESVDHAESLVKQGKVNTESDWSFDPEDGNNLLGEESNNWEKYSLWHLAYDSEENKETKAYYKYPYGKNGEVYRSGLIAVKQRAGAEDHENVLNAADELLQMVDEDMEEKTLEEQEVLVGKEGPEVIKNDKEGVVVTQTFASRLIDNITGVVLHTFGLGEKEADIPQEDPEDKLTGFKVYKDSSGNYRWFGWATNKWIDREEEILTDAAHREFLNYLNNNPEKAPELWIWHTPGSARKHRADWWDYQNGFFMYSGELTEAEANSYSEKSTKNVGMSHGFYVLDKHDKYILKYRTFEVSELPRDKAANAYTGFDRLKEEKMFDPEKRQYLVDRLGDEKVAEIEAATEEGEKALEELGVEWKEIEREYEEEIAEERDEELARSTKEQVEAITKQVVAALNVPGLMEVIGDLNDRLDAALEAKEESDGRIEKLEEAVEHLLETEDERMSKELSQPEPFNWDLGTRNKRNAVDEDELDEKEKAEVEKAMGEVDWLQGLNPYQQ